MTLSVHGFKICAAKLPSDFHCEIEIEKDIFVHFNFILHLKIEKRQFFFNFQFSIFVNPYTESAIQFSF